MTRERIEPSPSKIPLNATVDGKVSQREYSKPKRRRLAPVGDPLKSKIDPLTTGPIGKTDHADFFGDNNR